MKTIPLLSTFLLLLLQTASSQTPTSPQDIAQLVLKGFEHHSMYEVLPHLSDDFTLLNYKGHTARMVLEQLGSQLRFTDTPAEFLEEEKNEHSTTFRYVLHLENVGKRQLALTFNTEQQLQQLELQGTSTRIEHQTSPHTPQAISTPRQRVRVVQGSEEE